MSMSDPPRPVSVEKANESAPERAPKRRWLRPLLFVLGAAPAVFAVYIMYFIARYSLAHDETECPFTHAETRAVSASVRVREERRRCIEEVEEHRWLVERGTSAPRELGRYPLEAAEIELGFPWTASLESGRVVITIENRGRGEFVLREPSADDPR